MMSDSEPLEADFSGLEIESADTASTLEDDLDLSRDFGRSNLESTEDEELVIAADSNGLSTKLDLARAYLDMGDDDGARQILDEVVAEGSEELRAEARTLLNRIGG
jgi:pilus assembly protein FimV